MQRAIARIRRCSIPNETSIVQESWAAACESISIFSEVTEYEKMLYFNARASLRTP